MSEITYRWINGYEATTEEWDAIEKILVARGWASLNRPTSRIIVAQSGNKLVGMHVLQLFPHAEPQWVHPSFRGTDISQTLADKMLEFLAEVKVRGFMVVADSPFAAKLCEARGMKKVESPVYVMV